MPTIALMGPPGVGKTEMAALTSPKKPVHIIDIDRKVRSMARLRHAIERGELTYKEIGETLTEDSMKGRLDALVKDEKGQRPPKGWTNFANYMGGVENNDVAKKAGTIVIDSYTQLGLHMKAHIQFLKGKSKFVWDDWNIWKIMWTEATTILVDYVLSTAVDGCRIKQEETACEHGSSNKDLVITIHERVSERPSPTTEKVTVKAGEKGDRQKIYIGDMDVLIAGSIDGAFGLEFGSYFTDVYALRVDVDRDKKPTWRCRVHPDGQRDLRCSFDTKGVTEFEPDFEQIWGLKPNKDLFKKREEVKK